MGRESKRTGTPETEDPEALARGLHLVATPIGNARDITLRALDVLARAEILLAEDTRSLRRLMEMHGIALGDRLLVSYHDRNAPARRPRIAAWLDEGRSLAYCSDAGTPLVSDPGYRLAALAIEGGHPLTAVPGPCAALAALVVSGLPSDRFLFAGFPPPRASARRRALAELAAVPATLILYESPRRLAELLADMAEALGPRPAVIARELTKRFEEVRRGDLATLAGEQAEAGPPRGEVVVICGPPGPGAGAAEADIDAALETALARMSTRDAAQAVAERLSLPRRQVYARALALSRADGD